MITRSVFTVCLLSSVVSLPTNKAACQHVCPIGWMRFQDSCYYYELQKMSYERAESRCLQRKATLFVAESMEEFWEVVFKAPFEFWTWIGLRQGEKDVMPKWNHHGGIQIKEIGWLSLSYTPSANGWSPEAKCAAIFNAKFSRPYTFFYPCRLDYYSVCKKRAGGCPQISSIGSD